MQHDEPEMHQLAGELSEGVLEEKEKQMALELMAKYNLGGQQGKSGTASPQSKTSSQILGLDNVSESSVGIHRKKKREQKQWEKLETQSEKSNRSKWSSNRSTKIGDYPCTAPNCGKMFTTA